jgi:predicted nucleic acid-binding Zn ribbon protein
MVVLMTWTPARDSGDVPLRRMGEDLDVLLRRFGGAAGAASATVFTRWAEAVGAGVAAHAQPLALRGTTLVVGVDAPAYATQLRMLTPQLLARLADLVGPGAVEAVEVRVRG